MGIKMNWKYEIIEKEGGYQVVEMHEDGSYAVLDGKYELWSEQKDWLIKRIKMMLADLEKDP